MTHTHSGASELAQLMEGTSAGALIPEIVRRGFQDLLEAEVSALTGAQPMLLEQMAEAEDRGLIRDPITDQLDAGKAAHGGHLDQGLLHGWVTEGIPLLQQMNAQHRCQRIGRPAAFLARFGVMGLDQSDQRLPRHDRLHLSEKLLALGLLLGRGQLVVRETELLATHHSSPGLRSQHHFRSDGVGFPGFP